MDKYTVSELLADVIINQNYRIQRDIQYGDTERGIKTKNMCVVGVSFLVPRQGHSEFIELAQELFPKIKNQSLSVGKLVNVNKIDTLEFTIQVYFPLPYKSAERVTSMKQSEFLSKMSLYLISQVINKYLYGVRLTTLTKVIKDPRSYREIWLRERISLIKTFFKELNATKSKRDFNEYL
ncbi:MAG: hypothetical protein HOP25_09980 [Methylotenera sp.]|nr:hypothetical protein [Methylotenera sp.]